MSFVLNGWASPASPLPFRKHAVSCSSCAPGTQLAKAQWSLHVRVDFWAVGSICFISVSSLMPVPHRFDDGGSAMYFGVREWDALFFLFDMLWPFRSPLWFHVLGLFVFCCLAIFIFFFPLSDDRELWASPVWHLLCLGNVLLCFLCWVFSLS